MKHLKGNRYQVKTAGYGFGDKLLFDAGFHRCGDINRGVGFMHNKEGWWVIGYEDLLSMARKARKRRKLHKEKEDK